MTLLECVVFAVWAVTAVCWIYSRKSNWIPALLWVSLALLNCLVLKEYCVLTLFALGLWFLRAVPVMGTIAWDKRPVYHMGFLFFSLFFFLLIGLCLCVLLVPDFQFVRVFVSKDAGYASPGQVLLLFGRILLVLLLLFLSALEVTHRFLDVLDRIFTKKKELCVIQCRVHPMKGICRWYYMEGISNGKVYSFYITKKLYENLKYKKSVVFQASRGCMGGIYITKMPGK